MDPGRFTHIDATTWRIEPHGSMRVPAIIYADENLIRDMDDKVYQQAVNVATLPGIVEASYAMPDAHWGYGFPIGGVAAFDPDQGGVISAGGVGFASLELQRYRAESGGVVGIGSNCCRALAIRSSCARAGDANRQPSDSKATAVFLIMATFLARFGEFFQDMRRQGLSDPLLVPSSPQSS